MDATDLARRLTGKPITAERMPKFLRHLTSAAHFEQVLAAITDEAVREQVRALAGPLVRRRFGR